MPPTRRGCPPKSPAAQEASTDISSGETVSRAHFDTGLAQLEFRLARRIDRRDWLGWILGVVSVAIGLGSLRRRQGQDDIRSGGRYLLVNGRPLLVNGHRLRI